MEILGTDHNLENILCSIKDARVDIAVAFASKTKPVVDKLIANGNEVYLTIGTINCFSDPVFFKNCQEIASQYSKLDFAVDFRYHNRIHWKVYLVSPNIVIIGSSNFTTVGLSMSRDTAVMIEDDNLYREYRQILSNLRANERVVAWNDKRFDRLFAVYEKQHRNKPLPPINGPVPTFTEWFAKEETDSLPVFIWENDFTPAEKIEFDTEVIPHLRVDDNDSIDYYRIGFAYNEPHDYEGKVILTMRRTGAQAKFEFVTKIIHNNEHWWLCGIKRKSFQKPFVLANELKQAMRQVAENNHWQGKTILDSNDLQKLVEICRPSDNLGRIS